MERDSETLSLVRTLQDAGCGASSRERFLHLREQGKTGEQLRLLRAHRAALLKKVHDNQRRIDCLDFLVFSMTGGYEEKRRKDRPR